jgi:hypothetical protein
MQNNRVKYTNLQRQQNCDVQVQFIYFLAAKFYGPILENGESLLFDFVNFGMLPKHFGQ